MVGADLRAPGELRAALIDSGLLAPDTPTLILAECVLQYLDAEARPAPRRTYFDLF